MKWELPANSRIRGGKDFWKLKFQPYIFFLYSIRQAQMCIVSISFPFHWAVFPAFTNPIAFQYHQTRFIHDFTLQLWIYFPLLFNLLAFKKNLPFSFLFGRMGGILYQQVYILNTGKAFFHVGKSNLASHFEPS